jgi:GAF domain-containing protein
MEKIKVMFLNLSHEGDEFQEACEITLKYLHSITRIELEEVGTLEVAKEKLADIDVFLLWLDFENSEIWNEVADFRDEVEDFDYIGFIVIFGFETDVQEYARDAMLRGVYAFACPFNHDVLEAYIESIDLEIKHYRSLSKFQENLFQAKTLSAMVHIALVELQTHPLVGYNRATISLIDQRTSQRFLLEYDPPFPNPDRQLLKSIHEDKLIAHVDEKGIFIINDLEDLRLNKPDVLPELGWEDTDATIDIKSWVGLAAKRQGQSIAIITLDHKSPGFYARYNEKLNRFLEDFSEILADTIVDFLQERNARIVREITHEIGDDLKSEALMRQILVKLRDELDCDNCTYFKVSSLRDVNEIFLEEWVAANDPDTLEEQSREVKRSFKRGVGIVGSVLVNGKSRIVPHALESREFEPTFHLSGTNLSMLAVPVIPYIEENELDQPGRIIGVINCYKSRKDHFTVYDRDLVESIAQSTATVIERTMTLEYSNDISSKMNEFILNTDKTNLLKKICEHALKVTSARAAVIHRLKYSSTLSSGEEEYRLTGEYYTFPEGIEPQLPRLDGKGTTDVVIREKQTKEFAKKFGNFHCISEELRNQGINYQIVVPLMVKNETKDKQLLIGSLYLNKYSDIPFSEVEKFALELFASQAASTIYHQEFLSERLTWTKANTDLAKAIEAIASRNDPALLLKDIARYAYSLVGASFSYLALLNNDGNFEFKAAWPEYILAELNSFHQNRENFIKENGNSETREKIGVTKIAARIGKTVLIPDLREEQRNDSEYWQEYVQFREGTCSEMAVPIIIKDGADDQVIGVINLEHEKPYAFTEVHKEVIEHFARQVAIAFQKKSLVDSVSSKKTILIGLQRSLEKIIESPLQNMLYNAVLLTREAVEAHEVIVIESEQKKWKPELLFNKAVPDINNKYQSILYILAEISLRVLSTQQSECCADLKSLVRQRSVFRSDQKLPIEFPVSSGLCLPFSSRDQKIGVMWILFAKPLNKELSEEDKAIYQVYANQIALAYMNAKQSEELKQKVARSAFELTSNINDNYKDARKQAGIYFLISILSSLAGLLLIFYGIFNLVGNNNSGTQAANNSNKEANITNAQTNDSRIGITSVQQGGIATVIGVLLQGITVLAFDRGKAANERMDRYHRELYNIRQLEILLSATDQLDSEAASQVKQQIIQSTTNSWIQSMSQINKPQFEINKPQKLTD